MKKNQFRFLIKGSGSSEQSDSFSKVLWMNHGREEATWEREDQMKTQYPHLFLVRYDI